MRVPKGKRIMSNKKTKGGTTYRKLTKEEALRK
jgi:hypothetical protein